MPGSAPSSSVHAFEIRFRSRQLRGRTLAFPCDAAGNVDLDSLDDEGKRDYLFARIMCRRDCIDPEVIRTMTQ